MLKPGDGFPSGRPELKAEVLHLQTLLAHAGHAVSRDGFYGPQTEQVIQDLQKNYGISSTGTVDQATWQAIEDGLFDRFRHTESTDSYESSGQDQDWENFYGDLGWIHQQEGHAGKPYWPGGESGITLDPGFDLGHQDIETAATLYKNLLTSVQLAALPLVIGKKGRKAKTILNQSFELLSIRISRPKALGIFSNLARPYWLAVCKRMPGLKQPDTPGSVQTAFLSLAYNRGYNNKALGILESPVRMADWHTCAEFIGNMQQNHQLSGVRTRRQREAEHIFNSIS